MGLSTRKNDAPSKDKEKQLLAVSENATSRARYQASSRGGILQGEKRGSSFP